MQDEKPIAYASKALTNTQQRLAQIEKELFSVVIGCEKFHEYIYGRNFRIQNNHKPLEPIFKKDLCTTPPRLQRMLLKLQNMTSQCNSHQKRCTGCRSFVTKK